MASGPGLNDTFAALADPDPARHPGAAGAGEASVTELAEPFEMSLPAISKHLKVLGARRADRARAEAQWRPCRLRGRRRSRRWPMEGGNTEPDGTLPLLVGSRLARYRSTRRPCLSGSASSGQGRHWASRPRAIGPACSSTLRCWRRRGGSS